MRVVSLLPSATELVAFAGATNSLVGVSHECDYPSGVEALPKLTRPPFDHHAMTSAEIDAAIVRHLSETGSLYELDAELLENLRPDLIVTQGLCDVCAVSLDVVQQAASSLSTSPRVLSMNPTSLDEVLSCAIEVGDALGRGDAAREKVSALKDRLARVEEAVEGLPRPRVGAIEWLDPPFTAGHWVPEMVRLAGGEEVLAVEGEPSARLSWEDVFAKEPEALVLMPCGFDTRRALREAGTLPGLDGWGGMPAASSGRIWAVDANSYFSRPAPRLVEGVEILACLLHPDAFPDSPAPEDATRLAAPVAR